VRKQLQVAGPPLRFCKGGNSRRVLSRRWAVHIDYKAVVIRGSGLCIPATLGGELEHGTMSKMIIDLSAGTAAYIHGIG
jgi:hypothetical protein